MKSIKQKAQEWADMYPSCGMADKSFQAGANYVLEQIEDFQKLFSVCMNAHAYGYLKSIIEQLKK